METAANLCFCAHSCAEKRKSLAAHASVCFNYFPHKCIVCTSSPTSKWTVPARTCLIINAVWNVTETFISFAAFILAQPHKAGPRLEPVSLASRGGSNAVFVTHLVCVGCSYTFYPIPQVITEETLILLCFSVSSNRRTEEEMQPWLIRSTGYLNLTDVCVRCPDHSSVLLITLDEVHLLWRSRPLQQERTLDELRSVLIWGKDLM